MANLTHPALVGFADIRTQAIDDWQQYKIEGIDVQQEGAQLRAMLVTDADDPQVPASLLQWDMGPQ